MEGLLAVLTERQAVALRLKAREGLSLQLARWSGSAFPGGRCGGRNGWGWRCCVWGSARTAPRTPTGAPSLDCPIVREQPSLEDHDRPRPPRPRQPPARLGLRVPAQSAGQSLCPRQRWQPRAGHRPVPLWLWAQIRMPGSPQERYLRRLLALARSDLLELLCWRVPLPCHAEVERSALLWLAGKRGGLGRRAPHTRDRGCIAGLGTVDSRPPMQGSQTQTPAS